MVTLGRGERLVLVAGRVEADPAPVAVPGPGRDGGHALVDEATSPCPSSPCPSSPCPSSPCPSSPCPSSPCPSSPCPSSPSPSLAAPPRARSASTSPPLPAPPDQRGQRGLPGPGEGAALLARAVDRHPGGVRVDREPVSRGRGPGRPGPAQ